MNWKKWTYWLRGGVIGIIIPILSMILTQTCTAMSESYGCYFFSFPLFLYGITTLNFFPHFAEKITNLGTFGFLISILIWFVVGSLIGAIVGNMKSKK
jgi:hypothetical protein